MAGILPLIRGTATALYPLTRNVLYNSGVNIAWAASEQRYRKIPPLTTLQFVYNNLTKADKNTLTTFFETQKGMFDPSWFLVLGLADTGTISAASHNLTIAHRKFLGSMVVGQSVYVAGAGVAGAPLITTISGYTSPTQVTLTAAASTGVSGADTRWGTYYGNMALTADSFEATETLSTTYTVKFNARQTQNPGIATPSIGANYPTLSVGLTAQRPYTQARRFYTMIADQPSGPRYAFEYYDAGFANFPTGALSAWQIQYGALGDNDMATIENFFRGCCGRYGSFTFIDPDDSVSYPNCRFDQDQLTIQMAQYNLSQVSLRVIQTNG
jgi:hypothetical protein